MDKIKDLVFDRNLAHDIQDEAQRTPHRERLEKRRHVLFLLHGIRTRATWQQNVKRHIEQNSSSTRVVPIKYGFYDLARFLIPISEDRRYRQSPFKRVYSQVQKACDRDDVESVSVLAHSFGTYIIASILSRESDIRLKNLFLCASVVEPNFDWSACEERLGHGEGGACVVNDCGNKDILPILADLFSHHYGPSGRFGFGHGSVLDRYFPYSHSDFFSTKYFKKYLDVYVLPAINHGDVVEGPGQPEDSYLSYIVGLIRMKF